jgi:signal transduction histidine kinase
MWDVFTDVSGFVPRRVCGAWTNELIALHNVSDILIGVSYLLIPLFIWKFVRAKPGMKFSLIFYAFCDFIVSCGLTHFMDVALFYWPNYRLAGIIKLVCGVVSFSTVILLFRMYPLAVKMIQTPREIRERTETLSQKNDALEKQNGHLVFEQKAKDDFLAILGHELRNPLAAVFNAKQLLERDSAKSRELGMKILENQIDHLNRLVDDIINVARAVQGRLELRQDKTCARQIIERAMELAAATIKKHKCVVSVEQPPEDLCFVADEMRMAQVVSNLLTNAAKYGHEGGKIEVTVTCEGGILHLSVRDYGIGIGPEKLDTIFGLCVRTERAAKKADGMGVGLAMVRAIVELHGGHVSAKSNGVEQGAEFLVTIPITEVA